MFLIFNYLSILLITSNLFEFSFSDKSVNYTTQIESISKSYKFTLSAKSSDSVESRDFLFFANPVYNFKVIDINMDGVQDFCIGFIKTTRWNSTPKPKIHIYSHKNGKIYPIWRSSQIGRNLVDFDIDSTENTAGIRILENPVKDKYNIALYRWKSFGLKFVKYIHTGLDSSTSIKMLRSGK
jgi:hypothetical protein